MYNIIKLVESLNNFDFIRHQFVEGCDIQWQEYQNIISQLNNKIIDKNVDTNSNQNINLKEIKIRDIEDIRIDYDALNIRQLMFTNGVQFKFKCPLFTSEMSAYEDYIPRWQRQTNQNAFMIKCKSCHKIIHTADNLQHFQKTVNDGKCATLDDKKIKLFEKQCQIEKKKSEAERFRMRRRYRHVCDRPSPRGFERFDDPFRPPRFIRNPNAKYSYAKVKASETDEES